MAEKEGLRDSALRAVAIIGLIAILVLGAWGIIQLIFGLPSFFGSFGLQGNPGRSSAEAVTLTAPANATSGVPFTLSWEHANAGTGSYTFTVAYSCATGLQFAAPVPTGQMQLVPCNTPFNYTNATQSLELIPVLQTGTKETQTTITVAARRLSDNTESVRGTAVVTVQPSTTGGAAPAPSSTAGSASAPTTRPVSQSTGTYTPAAHARSLYGAPDLNVRILSVTPAGGRYSVQFQIMNVGTNVAPYGWEFTAALPTNPPYTYVSQAQQKLYPGDSIVYTLGFDAPQQGAYTSCSSYNAYPYTNSNYGYGYADYPPTYSSYGSYCNYPTWQYGYGSTVTITADPQGLVGDLNFANNTASASLGY